VKILDLSAGMRAVWYDKNHPLATFVDRRAEVNPTIVADTRALPEEVGDGYDLIVFDPPHVNCGPNSNMSRRYGHHSTKDIIETIEGTSKEAHRVAKPNGLLALKWNDHDISIERVFRMMPHWEPLFGHITKDGPGSASKTYWAMMRRRE
jgi:hypothetical protein